MRAVLPDTARRFARAIVMPNLKPPVTTVEAALRYRERIMAMLPADVKFEPLMTLYLTDSTSPEEIKRAKNSGVVHAIKYYPAGATTNAEAGVTNLLNCEAALAAMEEANLPLLIHGEVTDPTVDVFEREKVFIDRVLMSLLQKFPRLRLVFEHITTREAVDFVVAAPPSVASTVTAHHLLLSRNALFEDGIRPYHYCLPLLKGERDRQAILAAAISGNPKFFLGTDSAPHGRKAKETACGCAGIYTAHAGIELYAEAFAAAGALDQLGNFASVFGPKFYGLPINDEPITLIEENWMVPLELPFHNDMLVPLRAGGSIAWRLL
jgi:dihydroorotase